MSTSPELSDNRFVVAETLIANYSPRDASTSSHWPRLSDTVRDTTRLYVRDSDFVVASKSQSETNFKSILRVVISTVWWVFRAAAEQGRGTDVVDVFNPHFIEAWALNLDKLDLQRSVRRKWAIRVGEVVNPEWDRSEVVIASYRSPQPNGLHFYTTEEVEHARLQALAMTSEKQRDRLLGGMALSAGAGLRSMEMLRLTVGDVKVEHGVTLLDVKAKTPGARERSMARVVPMSSAWAPYLQPHLVGKDPDDFVLVPGRSLENRRLRMNPTMITQSVAWDGLLPEYRCLRTTWAASLILAGLPDAWIIYLAGWEKSHHRLVALRNELDLLRNGEVEELTPFMARRAASIQVGVDLD